MIDREHAEDEYSPFVAAPRARPRQHGSTPFVERESYTGHRNQDEDEAWRESFSEMELPDASSHEDEEKTTKHPDCTNSGDGIYGKDDRVKVANMLAVPYRWIVHLWIKQRRSDNVVVESGATGVLVSPRHILTVAHALTGSRRDSRNQLVTWEAIQIFARPARDDSDEPFGRITVNLPAKIAPLWTAKDMPAAYDYALLTLEKPIGNATFKRLNGAKLCYWGALSCKHPAVAYRVDPQTLSGATARTAGYPKDRGKGVTPHETTGTLSAVHEKLRTMRYSADACQGQSGSPVWVTVDGQHRLVGIMSRVGPTSGTVVRLTREMSAQLRKWMGTESEAFVEPTPAKTPEAPDGEQWVQQAYESETDASQAEGSWLAGGGGCGCASCGGRAAHETPWARNEADSFAESDTEFIGESESESFDAHAAEYDAPQYESTYETTYEADYETAYETDHESTYETEYGSEHAAEAEAPESDASSSDDSLGKDARLRLNTVLTEAEDEDTGLAEQQLPTVPTVRRLSFMSSLAAPLDTGFYDAATGRYKSTPTLQACVDAVAARPAAKGMQIALVDLTTPGSAQFAGVRHTDSVELASVRKIIVMYAAFQLQEDLRRLKAATAPATTAALISDQLARWQAAQAVAAGAPVTSISGPLGRKGDLITWNGRTIDLPAGSSVPDITKVLGSIPSLKFRASRLSMVPASACPSCDELAVLLQAEHGDKDWEKGIRFEQRLKMTIGISDNRATSTVIRDIGFAYINALMVQSGLFHPARKGGLWLGGNYAGTGWRGSPMGSGGAGTAGALAAFLTLLARGKLVNAAACAEMRALMNKSTYPGAATRSPVEEALLTLGGGWTVESKLGLLLKPYILYDAAIVQRTEGGKSLKYAVVILNARALGPTKATPRFREVARALHSCIRTNNGLPP